MTVASSADPSLNAVNRCCNPVSGNPAIEGMAPGERPSGPWQLAQGPARTRASACPSPAQTTDARLAKTTDTTQRVRTGWLAGMKTPFSGYDDVTDRRSPTILPPCLAPSHQKSDKHPKPAARSLVCKYPRGSGGVKPPALAGRNHPASGTFP